MSKEYIISYIQGRKHQLLKHFITGYGLESYNGKKIFKGKLANKCLSEIRIRETIYGWSIWYNRMPFFCESLRN